jgi:hypothetical protein
LILARTIILDVFTNEALANNYIDYMKKEGFEFASRQQEESMGSGSTDMGNITYAINFFFICTQTASVILY